VTTFFYAVSLSIAWGSWASWIFGEIWPWENRKMRWWCDTQAILVLKCNEKAKGNLFLLYLHEVTSLPVDIASKLPVARGSMPLRRFLVISLGQLHVAALRGVITRYSRCHRHCHVQGRQGIHGVHSMSTHALRRHILKTIPASSPIGNLMSWSRILSK
jgi:hypothetical protein